ncbi:MAG: metallophosphoesterase [Calditrichaeota bacterium]|nr:metallophosphoesterase [Calditrichota bacterium]
MVRMLVFFTIFLSLYGAEHLYIYKRLAPLLGSPLWLLVAFLVLVPLPLLSHLALHQGQLRVSQILGWIAFTWMGLAFLLFSCFLLADVLRLIAFLVTRSGAASIAFNPLLVNRWALGLALLAGVGAFLIARGLTVVRVPLQHPKLAGLERPLRVLQISDLHLGLLSSDARIQRVADAARALEPDLILCTGDLVDGPSALLQAQAAILADLHAPLGKFAVTGNHEAYSNPDAGRSTIEAAGFRLLRGEAVQILPGLSVAGIDDPTFIGRGPKAMDLEQGLLASLPATDFRILLKHQPILPESSAGLMELQLSGHTHGGQIFPFGFLTSRAYPVRMGLSSPREDFWLYLSRGTGSWGPPMRLPLSPELTLLELSGPERPLAD